MLPASMKSDVREYIEHNTTTTTETVTTVAVSLPAHSQSLLHMGFVPTNCDKTKCERCSVFVVVCRLKCSISIHCIYIDYMAKERLAPIFFSPHRRQQHGNAYGRIQNTSSSERVKYQKIKYRMQNTDR